MRTEETMYQLLQSFALKDDNIRAIYMNGSRTNPKIDKDILQDFDIVYVVKEIKPYIVDKRWISNFGELAVMQEPDSSMLFENVTNPEEQYTYLMQFEDGNRIDLKFQTIPIAKIKCLEDKLAILLLDKDSILPTLPPPSEEDYYVTPPTLEAYLSCCNEFWWVSTYIAKGLWRGEFLYSMEQFNLNVRPMLLQMLDWYAGIDYDFKINTGKSYKYLNKYLPSHFWSELVKTYPSNDMEAIWQSLFTMCDLFELSAIYVGDKLKYPYNYTEGEKTKAYLEKVKLSTPILSQFL